MRRPLRLRDVNELLAAEISGLDVCCADGDGLVGRAGARRPAGDRSGYQRLFELLDATRPVLLDVIRGPSDQPSPAISSTMW